MENDEQANMQKRLLFGIGNFLQDTKSRKEGIRDLAIFCQDEFHLLTLNGEIYVYNQGVYENDGEKKICAFVQRKFSEIEMSHVLTTHVLNETIAHIKRDTYKESDGISEPKDKICLENGILDLITLVVEQHTHTIIFFNKLPVKHDSKATCPEIKRFLSEIVKTDSMVVLQEVAGYCLYKNYPIHKAIMLVGTGANGKSTFIKLLKEFLGAKNCTSIPLHQLESNRFAIACLHGKLTNMFADLPSRALKETSCFKMLTGEDLVPAEKKFKEHFFFTNYAKMIFSANQIPRSPDESDAFFRRWVIVSFPHQFVGTKADKKLFSRISSPEELSGFLNFAIEGLKRLLEQNDFNNAKSIEEVRETYIRQSDSVAAFVMDEIEISSDANMEKKRLYTRYCDYCRERSYPIVPENTFHRQLQAQVRVEDYRPSIGGQRVQCWKGIILVKHVNDVNEDSQLRNENKIEQSTLKVENNPDKVDNGLSVSHVNDVNDFSHLKNIIYQKCAYCGLSESHAWSRTGKPMCELCLKNERNKAEWPVKC